jgi:ParB/RepB/Spo0J family partition protein
MQEMPEFRYVSVDLIDESPDKNPRRVFAEEPLQELANSIREHGVLQPVLVTPNGDRYSIRAGARRVRAARLAGLSEVPVRVCEVDPLKATAIALIENIHRSDLDALDEATTYRRILDEREGLTLDGLSAIVLKPRRYIHEQLRLLDLIPEAQDLLAQGVLPIEYARLLARAPQEKQPEGLSFCFSPLFSADGRQREYLAPLASLKNWFERAVRLDPRSEDTKILLPEVAAHVEQIETQQNARILMLSTLYNHGSADRERRDKPILQRSWKLAEGDESCKYAQPGLVVIGPQKGERFQVCIDKARCTKHWREMQVPASPQAATDGEAFEAERRARLEAEEKRRAEEQRWETELRPIALRVIADRTENAVWTPQLLERVVEGIASTPLFGDVLLPLTDLSIAQYPQALIVHLAAEHSWSWDRLSRLLKHLGVPLSLKDINSVARTNVADSEEAEQAPPKEKTRRKPEKKNRLRKNAA